MAEVFVKRTHIHLNENFTRAAQEIGYLDKESGKVYYGLSILKSPSFFSIILLNKPLKKRNLLELLLKSFIKDLNRDDFFCKIILP